MKNNETVSEVNELPTRQKQMPILALTNQEHCPVILLATAIKSSRISIQKVTLQIEKTIRFFVL